MLIVAAILALGVGYYVPQTLSSKPAEAVKGDASAKPKAASATPKTAWAASAPGRVEPSGGEVRIGAQGPGRIAEVLVSLNDKVAAGDLMVRLDDEELIGRINSATAEAAIRKRDRDNTEVSGKAQERRTAEDGVANAERQLVQAREEADRQLRARRAGSASDADLDKAREAVSRAKDRLDQARATLRKVHSADNLPTPTRPEGALISARAELSLADAALERTRIRAASTGTVLQVNAKAGETAAPSPEIPLVIVGNLSSLQVRAELDSVTRTVDGVRQHGEARLEALQRLGSDTAERVQGLLAELHATAYVWDPSLVTGLPDASGRATLGYHSSTGGPTAHPYLRFEEIFRGPETLIKGRQRGYVEMLRGRPAIVDIGCGRGELLDLCREAGIPARGVDVDPGMVERCRAKGHTVAYADALVYLGQRSDGSLDAIVSTQFIEHLPYEDLIRFLQLSYLKLARDGLFIAETVNPHSIQAFKAFWTDLTHRRPIFPETLLALCRLYGFEEAAVVFPTGTGDVQTDRWSQGDYAVVARRGAAGLGTAATACGQ
jgi:HlyD family secretion protein